MVTYSIGYTPPPPPHPSPDLKMQQMFQFNLVTDKVRTKFILAFLEIKSGPESLTLLLIYCYIFGLLSFLSYSPLDTLAIYIMLL